MSREIFLDRVVFSIVTISVIILATLATWTIVETQRPNWEADRIYNQSCINMGGILVDKMCVDPVKFKEAKIFIQLG